MNILEINDQLARGKTKLIWTGQEFNTTPFIKLQNLSLNGSQMQKPF